MADHEQAGHLIDTAVARWGQLDILVNNAGIVRDAAIWNMKPDDFDAVIRVHLRGTWSCSHHGAVHWRNRAKSGERVVGRIINTTSGAGLTGNFGQSAYAAAKAAIVGLTLTLAQELGAYGVTANAVGPAGATRLTGTMPQAPPVVEARRGAGGRVAAHGPGEQLAPRGLAGQRRVADDQRTGHPVHS